MSWAIEPRMQPGAFRWPAVLPRWLMPMQVFPCWHLLYLPWKSPFFQCYLFGYLLTFLIL